MTTLLKEREQVTFTIAAALFFSLLLLFAVSLFVGTGTPKLFLDDGDKPLAGSISGKTKVSIGGAAQGTLVEGASGRVVVIMGMPAITYRWYFRPHSIKSLERGMLGIVGIAPVYETLISLTGGMLSLDTAKWFKKLERLEAGAE